MPHEIPSSPFYGDRERKNHFHDREVEHTSPYLRHKDNQDHFLVLEQSEDGDLATSEEQNEAKGMLEKALKLLEHQI